MLYYNVDLDGFECNELQGDEKFEIGPPYTICIEANSFCNLACNICISDSSPSQCKNDEWIDLAIQKAYNLFGPLRVVWSGGEPMLRSGLSQQLEASNCLHNFNVVATNGTKYVPNLKADWIDLSIYGYSDSSFQKHTNSRFPFKKIQENMKEYVRTYPRVSASFILGAFEDADLVKMIYVALEAGIQRLKFHRLSIGGRLPNELNSKKVALQAQLCELELSGLPVSATFTRSTSSDHKRAGYWVLKSPGHLTNSTKSLSLDDAESIYNELMLTRDSNRSLFS